MVRGAEAEKPEGAPTPEASAPGTEGRLAHLAAPDSQVPKAAEDTADSGAGVPEVKGGTDPAPVGTARRQPVGSGDSTADGSTPSAPVRPRRRRTALVASVTAAALLGAVVLAVNLASSGGDSGDRKAAGATAPGTHDGTDAASGRAHHKRPSASASPSPSRSAKTAEPSASASESAAHNGGGAAGHTGGVPVNVATRPYVYDNPCSQHFLVDSEPAQVGPPAGEQDAPRWAAAYGAVSSGEQRVALTVQGTRKETVVLEALHVRVVAKGAPPAWNDYAMGVGCGGNVETKSFDIDLDNGSPSVTVKNGQRDFPYKISESDPEVFYVTAHAKAHDVRWDLTLNWSSGNRRGTVHIDNNGTPFRTSAGAGRPGYDYPLGGSEWIKRQEQQP